MTTGRKIISYALDGVLAGLVFAFVQMLDSSVSRMSALFPFEAAASTFIGPRALRSPNTAVVLFGLVVFATFSATAGLVYHHQREGRTLSRALTVSGRLRPAVSGACFGVLTWAFAACVARLIYPWLVADGLYPWWMHAFFFGLPLGMFAAHTERRHPVELKIVYSDDPGLRAPAISSSSPTPPSPRKTTKGETPPRPKPGLRPRSQRNLPLSAKKRPELRLLVRTGPDSGPPGREGGR